MRIQVYFHHRLLIQTTGARRLDCRLDNGPGSADMIQVIASADHVEYAPLCQAQVFTTGTCVGATCAKRYMDGL